MTATPVKKFWLVDGQRRLGEREVLDHAAKLGFNAQDRTAVEAACFLGRYAKARGHKVEFNGFEPEK
jgi:hypothetical protein